MNFDYEFCKFRKFFNSMFSLSFDGKFKGLSTLRNLYGEKLVFHLFAKLQKVFRQMSDRRAKPVADIIIMRISNHTIKLYIR